MRCPDGHPLMAATLDLLMAPLAKLRPRVVGAAYGAVLEVGVGTGANFAHYGPVDSIVGIDPDRHMLARARSRSDALERPVELHQAGAEAMPFDTGRFNTAVATWVFCTIPDAAAAAQELHRVLKPGGRVFFVEHVAGRHAAVAALQRALNPLWQRLAGGCQLIRDPVRILREAGFDVDPPHRHGSEWTPLPMRSGEARKPS